MNAHNTSLINSLLLILISLWGYFSSETPSITAFIPAIFGVIILLCYNGIKKENKIISHIAVVLTLIVLFALFMPLNGSINRGDNSAIIRLSIMILFSVLSMIAFIKSFIKARKNKS
ncbi:MAG: hypothetical protein P8M03_04565 [Flavobacteriaceae bacterium]|nr:hypothetical protein [Flavobacteriaceae bacterium]|tara:strand:- start:913 stop:1263 length:351 start_codon:yes stop_codon:yes gene_type:complete